MNTTIFHLRARSPFHFGVRGVGIEETADHAESDTLFSALCQMIRLTEGSAELTAFLELCASNPPFLLSGAYPYVTVRDTIIRFYPAPLSLPSEPHDRKNKNLYKASWVSEKLFFAHAAGKTRAAQWTKEAIYIPSLDAVVSQSEHGALLKHFGDPELRLWTVSDVPRVTIDRITNASAVFQNGRLTFVDGGGLWSMFAWRNQSTWNAERVEALLIELGDSGLGGERSSGNGQFSVALTVSGPKLNPLRAGQRFVTLGLFRPTFAEKDVLANSQSVYNLVTRRGWISSPDNSSQRRKSVRMLTAGSVLTSSGQDIYGSLVEVTPDADPNTGNLFPHSVFRWGYALPIPFE